MEDSEARRFEKHIKKCSTCQAELVELEDVSSAALEIVDEAPESSYWESFYARTLNRIISRNVTPYEQAAESHKSLRWRIGSYSLAIVSIAALILLTINFLPDITDMAARRSPEPPAISESGETNPDVEATDSPESTESITPEISATAPEVAESEPVISDPSEAVSTSVESADIVTADNSVSSDNDILSYFRNDLPENKPDLVLNDLVDNSREAVPEEYHNINEDFRLSSSMIAAGILAESGNRYNLGRSERAFSGISPGEFGPDISLNGISGNWGYLSMPPDSVETEEFRRYLIELELIQTK